MSEVEKVASLKAFMRLRPLFQLEVNLSHGSIQIIDERHILFRPRPQDDDSGYIFDWVFDETTSQDEVGDRIGMPMVQQALRGGDGVIFAYGLTASGKSHTMVGPEFDGLIPRCLDKIFTSIYPARAPWFSFKVNSRYGVISIRDALEAKQARKVYRDTHPEDAELMAANISNQTLKDQSGIFASAGFDVSMDMAYSVFISYVEIYEWNNGAYDLFESPNLAANKAFENTKRPTRVAHKVKPSGDGYYVENLTWVEVHSTEEAMFWLKKGNDNRTVGETEENKASSRSHAIFTIKVVHAARNEKGTDVYRGYDAQPVVAKLSLVDLAGFENQKLSSGVTQHEGIKIKKSLNQLKKCFEALHKHQSKKEGETVQKLKKIPLTDSKLTKLLSSYLRGNGMISLLVCASTSQKDAEGNEDVLNFAKFSRQLKTSIETPKPDSHGLMRGRGVEGKLRVKVLRKNGIRDPDVEEDDYETGNDDDDEGDEEDDDDFISDYDDGASVTSRKSTQKATQKSDKASSSKSRSNSGKSISSSRSVAATDIDSKSMRRHLVDHNQRVRRELKENKRVLSEINEEFRSKLKHTLGSLKGQLSQVTEDKKALEILRDELEERIKDLALALTKAHEEYSTHEKGFEQTIARLERENHEKGDEIRNLKAQLERLQTDHSKTAKNFHALESENKALKMDMKMKGKEANKAIRQLRKENQEEKRRRKLKSQALLQALEATATPSNAGTHKGRRMKHLQGVTIHEESVVDDDDSRDGIEYERHQQQQYRDFAISHNGEDEDEEDVTSELLSLDSSSSTDADGDGDMISGRSHGKGRVSKHTGRNGAHVTAKNHHRVQEDSRSTVSATRGRRGKVLSHNDNSVVGPEGKIVVNTAATAEKKSAARAIQLRDFRKKNDYALSHNISEREQMVISGPVKQSITKTGYSVDFSNIETLSVGNMGMGTHGQPTAPRGDDDVGHGQGQGHRDRIQRKHRKKRVPGRK